MYLLLAGNHGQPFNFNEVCRFKSYDSDDVESEAKDYLDNDYCVIIDGEDGSVYRDMKVVNWENRANARTVEEAAKVIANKLSDLNIRNPDSAVLREIESYAQSKGVPFSATVHTQFLANFNQDNPMWDSSSAYC